MFAFYSKLKCWALRASGILRVGFFLGENRVGKYRGPRGHTLVTMISYYHDFCFMVQINTMWCSFLELKVHEYMLSTKY
jgi:hypothetical protein